MNHSTNVRSAALPDAVGGASSVKGYYRLWAALGGVLLATEAYTLARWIHSPFFHPSPVGSDPITTTALLALRSMEAIGAIGFFVALWFFLISPLINKRGLNADGKIFIAMITAYWLDPLYNFTNFVWYYNAYAFNMGSWLDFVPGASAPGMENFPEPIFGAGCLWFLAFAVAAKFGAKIYERLRIFFGTNAQLRPLLALFIIGMLFNFAFENIYIRMGVFGFASTWRPITLWAGTIHQFPLYEPPLNSVVMTCLALVRYHLDSDGAMFFEAGLSKAQVRSASRTALSILATTGFGQGLIIFAWMIPFQLIATHVDTFAPLPSYLSAGICGSRTPRACPDGQFGIPTRYMDRSFVVAPDDLRLKAS